MNNKIYVNGFFLTQAVSGVSRFAFNLLKSLDDLLVINNSKCEIICIVPYLNNNIKFNTIRMLEYKSKFNCINRNHILWEQLVLPCVVKKKLLINLCNFAPLFKHNQLVVIHDVIPFRYPNACSLKWRTFFKFMVNIFVKRSKYIASVSGFSGKEIKAVTNVNRDVIVLGNSGEHILDANAELKILDKLNITSKKYILTVSSQSSATHKNFTILGELANKINLPIVATGNADVEGIIYAGRVTNEELRALYENALIFVCPSLYEGFGIPILEALHCKIPCVVSDIEVFREIGQDAVLYFNPTNVDDLVKNVNKLVNNHELYQEVGIKAKAVLQCYSWMSIANRLYSVVINEGCYS